MLVICMELPPLKRDDAGIILLSSSSPPPPPPPPPPFSFNFFFLVTLSNPLKIAIPHSGHPYWQLLNFSTKHDLCER
jgi:hypothetical protein